MSCDFPFIERLHVGATWRCGLCRTLWRVASWSDKKTWERDE